MAVAQPKQEVYRLRIPNPRSARTATQKRIVKNARARYRAILRIGMVLTIVLAALMGYVMLTSNETSLSYALEKAQARRAKLEEVNAHLDDRVAELESDQRLAAVAAKLGMREPEQFALVRLPKPAPDEAYSRFPVFASIAGFFGGTR
jgi:cell division protein FtsL